MYNYKNINILIIAIWIISSLIVFAFEIFILSFNTNTNSLFIFNLNMLLLFEDSIKSFGDSVRSKLFSHCTLLNFSKNSENGCKQFSL